MAAYDTFRTLLRHLPPRPWTQMLATTHGCASGGGCDRVNANHGVTFMPKLFAVRRLRPISQNTLRQAGRQLLCAACIPRTACYLRPSAALGNASMGIRRPMGFWLAEGAIDRLAERGGFEPYPAIDYMQLIDSIKLQNR